ncbi:MAG: ROK family protein [Erysipelotrichaceae bacterium]|nr:ROK family protein [Erysipelotrichaceae bacterium]
MKLLVFDIGGTEIKYSIMDETLSMEHSGHVPTPIDSFESFSKIICDIYQEYKEEIEGIAMSILGFVDSKNGVIKGGGLLRYNWQRPLRDELSRLCGCKVVMENDGKAAVKAEYRKGSLIGTQNAAVFVVGTGVGGGLVVNGQLLRGIHETAGEFSFISSDLEKFNGPDSFVGYTCSTRSLLDEYKKLSQSEEAIDGRQLFERLSSDKAAKEALDHLGMRIAKQIYNLYWILDLEKVAIGGGISAQPALIEAINTQFKKLIEGHPMAKYLPIKDLQIVKARYGNEANQIGAFLTYLEQKEA